MGVEELEVKWWGQTLWESNELESMWGFCAQGWVQDLAQDRVQD